VHLKKEYRNLRKSHQCGQGSYDARGYATSNKEDNPRWGSSATGNSANDAKSTGSSVFGLMEGFQADETDEGNVRDSNKVGEIGKMMSDEEVDHVSHYRDKIKVVDFNEMAIKEVIYVEPVKDVRFT
jgi:hypothetical protein